MACSPLIFMAVRLLEMRRILKPTGSIYLHCDPTASHYLKLLMDGIFAANFVGRLSGGVIMLDLQRNDGLVSTIRFSAWQNLRISALRR